MNEKYRQYFNLTNDKNLINSRIPTEQEKEIFYRLRDLKREEFKKGLIAMTIILLFIVVIGIAMKNLWGIILILFFGYIELGILKDFLASKNWEVEYCSYGSVTDKFMKEDKNDSDKDYYVIVNADGNDLKYKLKKQEFSNFEISDEVIVFAIKEKKETFVAKR